MYSCSNQSCISKNTEIQFCFCESKPCQTSNIFSLVKSRNFSKCGITEVSIIWIPSGTQHVLYKDVLRKHTEFLKIQLIIQHQNA